jgi:hypothetical protein
MWRFEAPIRREFGGRPFLLFDLLLLSRGLPAAGRDKSKSKNQK